MEEDNGKNREDMMNHTLKIINLESLIDDPHIQSNKPCTSS